MGILSYGILSKNAFVLGGYILRGFVMGDSVPNPPTNPEMQKLLRECLYWVCKYNFHPIMQKISSSDNHLADMISRNHNEEDISNYFYKHGYKDISRVLIPLNWFNFIAEW